MAEIEKPPTPPQAEDEGELTAADEGDPLDATECGRCGSEQGPLVAALTADGPTVYCAPCIARAARDPALRAPVGGAA